MAALSVAFRVFFYKSIKIRYPEGTCVEYNVATRLHNSWTYNAMALVYNTTGIPHSKPPGPRVTIYQAAVSLTASLTHSLVLFTPVSGA